jgi:tRNA wybutosine-synthesizing protein 1
MDDIHKNILKKQQYAVVGNHSGVKLCHWMRQSLLFNRECYKQTFYGIKSHRCLQMSPSINHCNHLCLFCWRYQGFNEKKLDKFDNPKDILNQSIAEQKKLITGYKGDNRCDKSKWIEANNPNMVACSLSGEPTLYPKLGEFFDECHKKNMITFLVTNGTNPESLVNLDPLPKQLYVSIVAPNKDVYKKICSPLIPKGWEKINETLEILSSLKTRTVIRHTLINNWNIKKTYINDYAKLIRKANPMFIEPKGYVFVGYSRKRMHLNNMPTYSNIREFGVNLANIVNYNLEKERSDSRVLLLTRDKNTSKID